MPRLCPSSAVVDTREFTVEELRTNSDQEFKGWSADLATKYPVLLRAYVSLKDCYDAVL
ncbi:TraF protein [Stenotrophomonas phage StenR_269]|nr:TraF protein [Stenotrophomonas phage StenR_269]